MRMGDGQHLLLVHDPEGGGQHDVTELTRRQQVGHPLLDALQLNIEARGDDAALVDATDELDHNLPAAVVVDDLELTDVPCVRRRRSGPALPARETPARHRDSQGTRPQAQAPAPDSCETFHRGPNQPCRTAKLDMPPRPASSDASQERSIRACAQLLLTPTAQRHGPTEKRDPELIPPQLQLARATRTSDCAAASPRPTIGVQPAAAIRPAPPPAQPPTWSCCEINGGGREFLRGRAHRASASLEGT